ncbi:MAG: calcium-translocating P-type ATPase, SERCA-type [Sulfobacillus acidophilus]|uniref:Calcium-translocating P-type ATPase, SERCA-type n=1 Tax=Sulfobacillus acidophilus TaxID=53633 RepID=A0A2T2WEZ6_9FIRM|nr:MAG: calcium-translocating P-type ATPase, SERCA-type [Sulfobacillus acidophilus]
MAVLWHTLQTDETVAQLHTDAVAGLSAQEAQRRLTAIGPNALKEPPRVSPITLLVAQFKDFMVLVLLGATLISFLLGETGDGITIIAIVMMNAILGFLQEFRAEKSVQTLRSLTAPQARVVRGGLVQEILARDLVPGDLIQLEAGDRIPADARLIAAVGLQTDEAVLTGESTAVTKMVRDIPDVYAPMADRTNMVFMGTTVARGRARALVVATGMDTEMGTIAHLIREAVDEQTPLKRRLEQLGKILVLLSLAIVAIVVITGLMRGEPLYQMFLTGVSLAVAAIPEGLPAIVTIALALGVQRMIKAHAIVRRLPAVETLGCTTVICSDKTGTLTRNHMTVTDIWASGVRFKKDAASRKFDATQGLQAHATLLHVVKAAALCNNAQLEGDRDGRYGSGQGDPTELALLEAAHDMGVAVTELSQLFVRVGEIPFESERQRMAVMVRDVKRQTFVYVKGAADVLLPRCQSIEWAGQIRPLDEMCRRQLMQAHEAMTQDALRVLLVAYRPIGAVAPAEDWESRLIVLGLAGMIDPPRSEAQQAVRVAHRAGVQTVMITGDHPNTARAIAQELGMLGPHDEMMTGRELDQLSDDELLERVERVRVYARVSPPHKLRVVRAWKRRGDVVAMTGDGVNDAPAVKEADIGVAMGLTGTDVTKEASAMILTDDNFATIVQAIREGRAIYDNIRKFIRYLLSCNIGEVLVMFLAVFMGMPLPLLPIQILFVNLVTDGLPAMALGVDPPAPGVMDRRPRSPKEGIFARGLGSKIAFRGLLIGVSTLVVFALSLGPWGLGLREARSMALATLILSQLFHVFDARTEERSFLEVGLLSNPWVVMAVLSSVAMLVSVLYIPWLSQLFKTDPLAGGDWLVVVIASGFIQFLAVFRDLAARPFQKWLRLPIR